MADIRSFFMGGGAKKKTEEKTDKKKGEASKCPKEEAKQSTAGDDVIEVNEAPGGSKKVGSKRDDSKASLPVSVDESPNKRLRTAEKGSGDPKSSPAKSVVKSKFFADSPTKAVAARKRKEQETVEVISTDSDDEKAFKKAGKMAKIEDLNTLAKDDEKEQGGAAKKPPKEQGARKHPPKEQRSTANKSPAKTQVATDASDAAGPGKEGALASKRDCKTEELKKKDETTANKTPQGKLTSPPNSTPPTKKDASKVESGEKSTAAAKAKVEEQAEEAPKKKFNPWNHEKAEVPNKHLRDQKIAENRGKENCLDKLTFVITGILDSMEREECADLIKSYGGKVTGGVSGKTAYLIVGSDPGESKLKKATEKGVKTIDEDGLFAIIKKSGPPSDAAGSGSGAGSAKKLVHDAGAGEGAKKIAQQGGGAPTPVSNTPQSRGKEAAETTPQGTGQAGRGHAEDAALWMRRVCADAASLWVDKYKPKGAEDLMGNGDKREQLRSWLAKWGTASASSGAKAGGSGGGWGVGGKVSVIHKAVLMHGPPGIGKTSSARVVIESLGYTMIELNASDVRNKSGLQDKVASLTQNQSISTLIKGQKKLLQTFSGPKGGSCKFCGKNERQHFKGAAQNCFSTFIKGPDGHSCHVCGKEEDGHYGEFKQCYGTCLVMDEVDGMSAGDRGGVAELIQMIKTSRVPVICIANDGYNQKIKSLKNHCLELKFAKPSHTQVVKRLKMIAEAEGFRVQNEGALEKLYLSSGSDIRHVINALQTWRLRTSELRYGDVSGEIARGDKDASVRQTSPFDVVPDWFLSDSKHRDASFRDRLDMFFFDTDLMPLFVQENYVKVRVSLPKEESASKDRGDYNIMRRMAEAADNISQADLVNTQIRRTQNWSLLPVFGNLSTITAAFPIRGMPPPNFFGGKPGGPPPLAFPGKCLGHQSTMSKKSRLAMDVARCMKQRSFANTSEVTLDYLSVLRHRLCAPLLAEGVTGVDATMQMMDEYLLSRDELDTICSELRLNDISVNGKVTPIAEDCYSKVDSKVKAALTRAYNKESHCVKFIKPKMSGDMTSKGKAKKAVGRSGEEKDSDDEYDDDDEHDGGEDDAGDAKKKGPAFSAKPAKGGAGAKKAVGGAAAKKPAASRKK